MTYREVKLADGTTTTVTTIEVDRWRYEELIAKEERLNMLENAIMSLYGYINVETLKTMFGIREKKDE